MTREDAIFFITRFRTKGINEKLYEALGVALEEMSQPEQKKGEWLDSNGNPSKSEYGVYCPKCHEWSEYRSRFCMNCGKPMEVSENADN